MLEPVIKFLGFGVTTILISIIISVVPVIVAVYGLINKEKPTLTEKILLNNKIKIFIFLGVLLVFGICLNFANMAFMKDEIEGRYKPEFILINESIVNEIPNVDWKENEVAFVARYFFNDALKALSEKKMSSAKDFFYKVIGKCAKTKNKALDKLKAAAYNNLVLVEYLDPNYGKLKASKLNSMKHYINTAVSIDEKNETILRNRDFVNLHLAIYVAVEK